MTALVSTIIPVHNRPVLLRDAVNSVLEQTYRPIEMIIVDDGSTDETPDVIAAYHRRYPEVVSTLRTDQSGPGAAREAGRSCARGNFIQYLDSDDMLMPDKFAVQVAALDKHPACGIAYGISRLVDEQGQTLKEPFKGTGERYAHLFPRMLVDRWWNTHTPLWRRDVCDRVGSWRDMWMGEDWEYDGRAAALGVELVYCPDVVSAHRSHPSVRLSRSGLTPAVVRDLCHLIVSLEKSAAQANLDRSIPELAVFSRWAFLTARQAGAAGLSEAAAKCFAVACRTAAPERARGLDFRLYRALVGAFGWRFMGTLSAWMDRGRSRKSRQQTPVQEMMA